MFDLPNTKMFRDSVHGYIEIPKCFVDHLIDNEMFQRLRNIDQTGMRVLYPTAKHDRFGHSLGVYHLGSKIVDTLLNHFSKNNVYWLISSDGKAITFWAKNKLLFLIACLLHDIGHTPFSHALEGLVLKNSRDGDETVTKRLQDKICDLEKNSDALSDKGLSQVAPHEQIGALYILEKMRDSIERIYDDLIAYQYPRVENDDFLYAEHYDRDVTIDKEDIDEDLAFVARMILGLKYQGFQPEKQIRNCFIELLNGKNFDVDKLDYVIRDTKMSGISNISIDTDRLLNSVSIVTKTKYINCMCENEKFSGLVATQISNSADMGTFRINGNFRGAIFIKKGSKVKIHKGSTFISLSPPSPNGDEKIKYVEGVAPAYFSTDTTIKQNGKRISREIDNNDELDEQGRPTKQILLDTLNGDPFSFEIKTAEVLSDFQFEVCAVDERAEIKLEVNGKCDLEISGAFSSNSTPVRFFETVLDGTISTMVLVENGVEDKVPNENCFNEFSIGWRKQAINVIANVMEARDYLYLWVYAHHKVIYYANFLIPIIANGAFRKKGDAEWKLDYNNIELIDDSYVWTTIKSFYKRKILNDEILRLCEQLFCRKYRLSLYKSLAEFDLLFEEIPIAKRAEIKLLMRSMLDRNAPVADFGGDPTAGYLPESFVQSIKDRVPGELDNIRDVVYVDAAYKSKELNRDETLVVMKNDVASLSEIPLLDSHPKNESNSYYFYIYYRTDSDAEDYSKEAKAFRKAIVEVIKEQIDKNKKPRKDE